MVKHLTEQLHWGVVGFGPAEGRPCGDEEKYPEKCGEGEGGPGQGGPSSEEAAVQQYQFSMLSSHLTQYDQRISKREPNPNIYRIGLFLEAAQKMEQAVKGGQDMESAFAASFTPSAPMERIAKKIGLGMEVRRGDWARADPPNAAAHPRDRWKKPRQKASGQVWSSLLNWEVIAYGHGGYHYNPHVSKPVALEPIGEEGGYHYFGPPADYGGSYGLYTDGSTTIATQRGQEIFSPVSGSPMKYVGPTTYEDVKKALSGSKFANLLHSCNECGCAYVSSADFVKSMSCIGCGQQSEYGNALMRGRNAKRQG